MSKKRKNSTGKGQVFLSPEKYMQQRVRSLELGKCYITPDIEAAGLGNVIVTRKHTGGKLSFAAYLIDIWCLGLKESLFRLRMDPDEFSFEERIEEGELRECTYEEAHNRIYGAIEFAREAGVKPDKSWAITRYMLEEDDDDIPLIDYPLGKDGEYFFMAKDNMEASKYMSTLRKHLGNNFKYVIRTERPAFRLDTSGMKKAPSYGEDTVYTYQPPEYPHELQVENPKLLKMISSASATLLTPDQTASILSLPHDSVRRDLEQVILHELGVWHRYDMDEDDFDPLLSIALILLGEVGNGDSVKVVLEVLRQSKDFQWYYFGDATNEIVVPTLVKIGMDRLDELMAFMKEPGLYDYFKSEVPSAVMHMAILYPDRRKECVEWFRTLIDYTTEVLPEVQIIDTSLSGLIAWDAVDLHDVSLLPHLKAMYATGCADYQCCGDYPDVEKSLLEESEPDSTEKCIMDVNERFKGLEHFGE